AVAPEGDQVDVGRVEHDLDGHQHGDRVAPDEHAEEPDGEGGRGEVEEPAQGDVAHRGALAGGVVGTVTVGEAGEASGRVAPSPLGPAADRAEPRPDRFASSPASHWARAIAPTNAAVRSRPATSNGTA